MERSRSGFTLLELLVVISIISMLMALILPAVQSARSSARRIDCLNRMRQIGMGVLAAAARSRDKFPAYGRYSVMEASLTCGRIREEPDERVAINAGGVAGSNWVLEILPELDAEAIRDRWDFTSDSFSSADVNLATMLIPVLVCPDDGSAENSKLSYVINCGYGEMGLLNAHQQKIRDGVVPLVEDIHMPDMIEFDWDADGMRTGFPNRCDQPCPCWIDEDDSKITRDTGLSWPDFDGSNNSLSISEVYDGMDNTLMIAENQNAGITGMWSHPSVVNSGFVYPVAYVTAHGGNFPYPPPPAEFRGTPNSARTGGEGLPYPSSSHHGVVNFVFASGAAVSIADTIDPGVYARLITPRGSVPRGEPWLAEQPLTTSNDY